MLLFLVALALALAVAAVVIARHGGRWSVLLPRPRRQRRPVWVPTVQHRELPRPQDGRAQSDAGEALPRGFDVGPGDHELSALSCQLSADVMGNRIDD